ncbi:hypothetical protein OSB04_017477 [Centaurea solstitialis]|uniref:Protein FAR1-RELATED SEQUENCE n=1 Tax=Centaurea solstitialis TaxID=347529 RepID=A0AA38W9I1_9ASTR|nr:hypothetical protein OSB04_017477 [Centaurea solstitialis]
MFGLLRTTSHSDSVNSYMNCFLKWSHNLVKFIAAYDDALSTQRDKHRGFEYITRNTLPKCVTSLPIERHATEVFTRNVFFEIQKELRKVVWLCSLQLLPTVNACIRYLVLHKNKKSEIQYKYEYISTLLFKSVSAVIYSNQAICILCGMLYRKMVHMIYDAHVISSFVMNHLSASVESSSQ